MSWRFGYDFEVDEMPIGALVGTLAVCGLAYGTAALVLNFISSDPDRNAPSGRMLLGVIAVGAIARLVLVGSEPMLEDDYQRYLWDGAVSAAGYNPYAIAPNTALISDNAGVKALAERAGYTLQRINHPELRTIYPPGAQAFFALAHVIKPFSLAAWRGMVMLADAATFALILLLLQIAGRPLYWSALYWWNPLVIKELTNSVHMEAVLMPFVLLAVWLAARRRPWLAATAIAVAGAIKIWPLVLAPVLLRAATSRWAVRIGAAVLIAVLTVICLIPMVTAGLDQSAGVVAYAEKWRTNGAAFSAFIWLAEASGLPSLAGVSANHAARAFVVVIVAAAALLLPMRPHDGPADVIQRAGLLTIIVFLVTPAQFPWYVVWIAPFLAILPLPGLVALAITMPLYYSAFYLMTINAFETYSQVVVWIVWAPVWLLLVLQLLLQGPLQRGRSQATLTGRQAT